MSIIFFSFFIFRLLPLGATTVDHLPHISLSLPSSCVTPTLCIALFITSVSPYIEIPHFRLQTPAFPSLFQSNKAGENNLKLTHIIDSREQIRTWILCNYDF